MNEEHKYYEWVRKYLPKLSDQHRQPQQELIRFNHSVNESVFTLISPSGKAVCMFKVDHATDTVNICTGNPKLPPLMPDLSLDQGRFFWNLLTDQGWKTPAVEVKA